MHFQYLLSKIIQISNQIFNYSLGIYIVLYSIEKVFPGFVTKSFSLDYLFFFTLVVGVISVFDHRPSTISFPSENWLNYFLVIFFASLFGAIVYLKSTIFTAVVATTIILSLNLLVLDSRKTRLFANFFLIISLLLISGLVVKTTLSASQISTPDKNLAIEIVTKTNSNTVVNLNQKLIGLGYQNSKIIESSDNNYINVVVVFSPQDQKQAEIVTQTVKQLYPLVQTIPPSTSLSKKIIIYIGQSIAK